VWILFWDLLDVVHVHKPKVALDFVGCLAESRQRADGCADVLTTVGRRHQVFEARQLREEQQ